MSSEMRTFLIFFTILVVGYTRDIPRLNSKFNSNAVIRQIFDLIKHNIKNGNIEEDLPILDPLHFNNKTLETLLPHKLISLRAIFTNGTLKNLANFQLEEIEFIKEEIAIDLLLRFPYLTLTTEYYNLIGDIYQVIPFGGEGKFDLEVHNYLFGGRLYLKQSNDKRSVIIRDISHPQFNVEQIISRTDFDHNIDNITNAIINDVLASYLTRFNQYISHVCTDGVIDILNIFLNKLDTWNKFAILL